MLHLSMRDSIQTTFLTSNFSFNKNKNMKLKSPYRDNKKFWITTGLYPHELLIDLGGTKPISEVKFITSGGNKKLYKIVYSYDIL